MKFCVIGAGASGCLYGGGLAEAGFEVRLLDVWQEHVDAINANGLLLDGVGGERRIAVRGESDPDALAGWADVAIILTDTNNTEAAARSAAIVLASEGYAITLQNGIGNVEVLTAILGTGRVLGGMSYQAVAMAGPGHATHTNAGATAIGEIDRGVSPRLRALGEAMEKAGLETVLEDDIMGGIWAKWVHNCALNPIAAVSGLRPGEIARNAAANALQDHVLDEIMAVVKARGVTLAGGDPIPGIKKFCRTKYNRPSMMQHMEAGKPTEIDSLNGALLGLAKDLGMSVPYNEAVVMLVKAREERMQREARGEQLDYAALEQAAKE